MIPVRFENGVVFSARDIATQIAIHCGFTVLLECKNKSPLEGLWFRQYITYQSTESLRELRQLLQFFSANVGARMRKNAMFVIAISSIDVGDFEAADYIQSSATHVSLTELCIVHGKYECLKLLLEHGAPLHGLDSAIVQYMRSVNIEPKSEYDAFWHDAVHDGATRLKPFKRNFKHVYEKILLHMIKKGSMCCWHLDFPFPKFDYPTHNEIVEHIKRGYRCIFHALMCTNPFVFDHVMTFLSLDDLIEIGSTTTKLNLLEVILMKDLLGDYNPLEAMFGNKDIKKLQFE